MKYFILGILFTLIISPAIEIFISILSAWGEYLTYIFASKIYKIKTELGILEENETEEENKNPIGFSTSVIGYEIDNPEEEEYIEEEQ